jgi:hypothetical protein
VYPVALIGLAPAEAEPQLRVLVDGGEAEVAVELPLQDFGEPEDGVLLRTAKLGQRPLETGIDLAGAQVGAKEGHHHDSSDGERGEVHLPYRATVYINRKIIEFSNNVHIVCSA